MRIFQIIILLLITYLVSNAQSQTIGLFVNDEQAYNGYLLWSPNDDTYLIDNCGRLMHKWESNIRTGLSVYLLENGNLLRTGAIGGSLNGAGGGGRIEEFSWEGERLWTYDISNELYLQHHDIHPMPNGNVLAIAWEYHSAQDAIDAGAAFNRDYWSEVVFEIKKIGQDSGQIVWEWHMWDHLIQDHDSTKNNFGVVEDHPELLNINYRPPAGSNFATGDWLHFNSVFFNPERDEIILSSRSHSEIYIIDHSTTTEEAASHNGGNRGKGGDILYRWGNPEAYGRGSSSFKTLYGQHDARVIPEGYPGAGNITMFNNGGGRPEGVYSSIEEITPPIDSNGNYFLDSNGRFGPSESDWQYVADPPASFYSNNMAGAHSLPNGNIMICESNKGKFFEITREGEVVWYYQNTVGANGPLTQGQPLSPFGNMSFRAEKYPPDYPAFQDKDITPGDPVELNPLPSDCEIFDGTSSVAIDPVNQIDDIVITQSGHGFIEIYNLNERQLSIHLLDLGGQIVRNLRSKEREIWIDYSDLPEDIYLLYTFDLQTKQSMVYRFAAF